MVTDQSLLQHVRAEVHMLGSESQHLAMEDSYRDSISNSIRVWAFYVNLTRSSDRLALFCRPFQHLNPRIPACPSYCWHNVHLGASLSQRRFR
jgi:hypothetical protein